MKATSLGMMLFVSCASVTPVIVGDGADLVLFGGHIYTMNYTMNIGNAASPRAEAVAIKNGRILAVGSAEEIRSLARPSTRVIDLAGRTVIPGLVDGHCHLYGLGAAGEILSLRGITSPEAVAALVAGRTPEVHEGEWIQGRGWDQNLWTPAEFPGHALLDEASPARPVVLYRIDGHALWANTVVMRLAGITDRTADPPGGRIFRDASGHPTGVFLDNAMGLIERAVPRPTREIIERRILSAADQATALGLTGVHEMGIEDDVIAVYRSLAAAGRLKLRVYAFLSGEKQMDTLRERTPDHDTDGTAHFVLRGVKLFADGALGSRGAALLAPYADEPGNSGQVLASSEELAQAAKVARDTGWQLAVHAIGDRANRMVLDAFAQVSDRDSRFRVEHAQVVAPEDRGRFALLDIVASMQPTHATSDMPWAEARLGHTRLSGAYAWQTIRASGAHLVGGSDFPVEDPSPLRGIYAAVTRMDPDGKPDGGWLSEERLSLDDAIRIFTAEPAWAAFAEAHHGKIARGYVADLTVLDRELHSDRRLLDTQVDMTIVGGEIVYKRELP